MSKGIFTISLDFELFWGVRDHRTLENYGENIRNVHNVVPRLLTLFSKYNVHCTWATVGFLFFNDKKEMISCLPAERPGYQKKEYDPYPYLEQNELEKIYHFAPALIEQIKKTPGQEIGTHTFSHFYTLEKNTTIEQFKSDLRAAIAIAKGKGIEIKSIVFPRNQYSNEHIKACLEEGIKIYRGNELSGAYKPISRENENIFRKGIRFADTYINITGHHCHAIPSANKIINVPASRFLRPYNPTFKMFDSLKLRRIKQGMKFAAKHGLVYQLWWHPHNFGKYMDENFNFLEQALEYYRQLNSEGKIVSQNLDEIYSNIK
ncbi:MAG TPA: polysaccharide deacetylase family protein [Chitinophagaceae bacterium]|nr:polysaccharide deacetylase family protein [Chitinophagaceae bacterium]